MKDASLQFFLSLSYHLKLCVFFCLFIRMAWSENFACKNHGTSANCHPDTPFPSIRPKTNCYEHPYTRVPPCQACQLAPTECQVAPHRITPLTATQRRAPQLSLSSPATLTRSFVSSRPAHPASFCSLSPAGTSPCTWLPSRASCPPAAASPVPHPFPRAPRLAPSNHVPFL